MGFIRGNIHGARTPPSIIKEIREKYETGLYTYRMLATQYKKSVVQIGRIIRGESFGDYMYAVQPASTGQALNNEVATNIELPPETEEMQRKIEESMLRFQQIAPPAELLDRPVNPQEINDNPAPSVKGIPREEFMANLAKVAGKTVEELGLMSPVEITNLEKEVKRFERLVADEMEKESIKAIRQKARDEAKRRIRQQEKDRLEKGLNEFVISKV